MRKEKKFIYNLHNSTKRDYLSRMNDNKIHCMNVAQHFEKDYWDGKRRYGYGGYKYISGRWKGLAKKLIKDYQLKKNSIILDIGCGKGYLLKEILEINPLIKVIGLDVSRHAIKNSHKKIKDKIFQHDIKKKTKFKNKQFDLVISLGTLHNLEIFNLENALTEIGRIGKKSYIMVEGYRNNTELFNLQCWALTCKSFFSKNEWKWLFKKNKYKGDYEFIYFN